MPKKATGDFHGSEKMKPVVSWLPMSIWFLIALAYLVFFVIELQLDFNQLLVPCEGAECNWGAIGPAEAAVLESRGLTTRAYSFLFATGILINVLGYWALGGLLFWRRSGDRLGYFMSLALVIMPIASYADADNVALFYPEIGSAMIVLSAIGLNIIIVFLYLFPNGKLYPSWTWIPLGLTCITATFSLLQFTSIRELPPVISDIVEVGFASLLFLALLFQVYRYRQAATAVEQVQTRWVLAGLVTFLIGPLLWSYLYPGGHNFEPGMERLVGMSVGWVLIAICQLTLPATLVIAMLRYRLWDIDLLIRRTLVYGSLTGTLALMYFGTVVTLQAAFGALTGGARSPLVTVVSTLVIAAMFNPVRIRLQGFIDRRFYRRKYDAEQSVAGFAASARDEVDINRLAGALLITVEETVQPETISLWITR